jgi:hypothetical protein
MARRFGVLAVAIVALGTAALAKNAPAPSGEPPAAFRSLLDCRTITEPGARLACYDKQVGEIADAQQKHDLVVVDRQQMRDARRGLFGFSIPRLAIFGGGDSDKDKKDEPEFTRIETTIDTAHQNGEGKWVITLADGAQWLQIDSVDLVRTPKAGMKIAIRKATMGSYFANIADQTAIRMRRLS